VQLVAVLKEERTLNKKVLFVRCGERMLPIGDEDRVLTLDAAMTPESARIAVHLVREAVAELGDVELRVGGPGMFVGMLAQALEHIPQAVDFVQLNQLTKSYEVWFSNTENL